MDDGGEGVRGWMMMVRGWEGDDDGEGVGGWMMMVRGWAGG